MSEEKVLSSENSPQAFDKNFLRKKRILALTISLLLVGIFFFYAYIRGSWAETQERNPSSASEDIVRQLYQNPEGRKMVRGAMLLEAPLGDVWKVITDYQNFNQIFSPITSIKVEQEEGGIHKLTGVASTFVGDYNFLARVKHEESSEKKIASWEDSSKVLTLNRGSWTLTQPKSGQTLLVYTLELEVKSVPNFLVRDFLLTQLKPMLRAVRKVVTK